MVTASAAPVTTRPTSQPTIGPGPGSFVFADPLGDPSKPITVWTWCPEDASPTTPILFVMHGTLRNGQTYRDNWVAHAEAKHVLLIVPEFSRANYPGITYNDGNMYDASGQLNDPSRWVYGTVEHLFDSVRQATGNRSATYSLYGHSAGGAGGAAVRAVHAPRPVRPGDRGQPGLVHAARSGQAVPRGGSATRRRATTCCAGSWGRDVFVMLGERDTRTDEADLPRGKPAMAEGPHRFARGQFFFRDLQAAAARLNVPLAWQLRTVPMAGHSDVQMSTAAADVLFP